MFATLAAVYGAGMVSGVVLLFVFLLFDEGRGRARRKKLYRRLPES